MQGFLALGAVANIAAGVLLLLFWWSYVIFLPYADIPSTRNLSILTQQAHWHWINIMGVSGSVCAVLGLPALYLAQADLVGKVGLVGLAIALVGSTLMVAPLSWDLVLWSPLAEHDLKILSFDGPIYRSRGFLLFFAGAGILQALGFALLGIASARAGYFSTWQAGLVALGIPLFALGTLAGRYQAIPRSLGMTAASIAFICMGVSILRKTAQ